MTAFLDTNVLIDFLTARGSFGPNARAVVEIYNGSNSVSGCFSSLSACDIVYILRNHFTGEVLRNQILALGSILEMFDTRAAEVKAALAGADSDFEDAVQRICAEDNGVDVIITRDKSGFADAKIPVMTPTEFLNKIEHE